MYKCQENPCIFRVEFQARYKHSGLYAYKVDLAIRVGMRWEKKAYGESNSTQKKDGLAISY